MFLETETGTDHPVETLRIVNEMGIKTENMGDQVSGMTDQDQGMVGGFQCKHKYTRQNKYKVAHHCHHTNRNSRSSNGNISCPFHISITP